MIYPLLLWGSGLLMNGGIGLFLVIYLKLDEVGIQKASEGDTSIMPFPRF